MSKLLESIEHIQCLVLDKRYGQFCKIRKNAKHLNLDIYPFLAGDGTHTELEPYDHIDVLHGPPVYHDSIKYPTWFNRPNAFNAWISHHKMILKAYQDGLENFMILEDDIAFSDDFMEILEKVEKDLVNWDMVYFGCYHNNNAIDTDNPNLKRMGGGGGFHGVLMNRIIMKKLLNFKPIGPFDWIAGKSLHQSYNCYAVHPCIINQEDGWSYVEGQALSKPSREKL